MKNKIDTTLNPLVVKSREFVHGVRYISSTNATKVISSMIAMVRKDGTQENFQEYHVTISDLKKLLGVRVRKEDFKKLQEELIRATLFIKDEELQEYRAITIFEEIAYKFDGSSIRLKFSNAMTPFLIDFKNSYLKYGIVNVLSLKSPYLIRLYEICKDKVDCNSNKKDMVYFDIEVQTLREIMMIKDSYQYSSHIKKNILNKAVEQFKEHTDISISFVEHKKSRAIDHLTITVKRIKEHGQSEFNHILKFREKLIEAIEKIIKTDHPNYPFLEYYKINDEYGLFRGEGGKLLLTDKEVNHFNKGKVKEGWEYIYKNRATLFDTDWLDSIGYGELPRF